MNINNKSDNSFINEKIIFFNSSSKKNENTSLEKEVNQVAITYLDKSDLSSELTDTDHKISTLESDTSISSTAQKISNRFFNQDNLKTSEEIESSKKTDYLVEDKEELFQVEGSQLLNILEEFIIPQSEDNPFLHTDLCVFADNYKGVLPNNGILETDFKALCKYVDKLRAGESFISIKEDADPLFKETVISQFITLLSRPMGRQLIERLESVRKPLFIQSITDDKDRYNSRKTSVFLNIKLPSSLEVFTRYGVKKGDSPLFIILAHELIHALQDFEAVQLTNFSGKSQLIDPNFHDLEEQYTIIGIKERQESSLESAVKDSEEWLEPIPFTPPISEALIRAEHGLPIRWTHLGTSTATLPPKLSEEQLSQIPNNPKEARRLALAALEEGRYDIFEAICHQWNEKWEEYHSWLIPLAVSFLDVKALALTLEGTVDEGILHQQKEKIETELKFLFDPHTASKTVASQIKRQKMQIFCKMYKQLKNKAQTIENPQKKFETDLYRWMFFPTEICREWLHKKIDSVEDLVNRRKYLPNIIVKILEIQDISLISHLIKAVENLPPEIFWHPKPTFEWNRWIKYAKDENLSEKVIKYLMDEKQKSIDASNA